jgi:hypothetical protein
MKIKSTIVIRIPANVVALGYGFKAYTDAK